ncbi:beta-1,3-glucosyltransferase beta3glc-t beta-3-glycosyltransferase [Plakobranchus ocellatus]|uniref:Mitochondria-eating protein n=1 Tax=Plakobranchus ocellatus TaxID=259542 RepID=A0AAV3YDA6_9GAST|nr:beta-1,3-glucosyltransferase beta3glc-t beta-3-glycosyltransferase [Plakobranchus ocellatus]
MSESGAPQTEAALASTLRHFSHGYGTILSLISQVTGEGSSALDVQASSGDEDQDEDDDDILPMSSSLSITERMRIISLNGILPVNGWGRSQLISVTGPGPTTRSRNGVGNGGMERDSGRRGDSDYEIHNNGETFITSEQRIDRNHVKQTISSPYIPIGMDAIVGTSDPPPPNQQVVLLEQEVASLKTELAQARDTIRKLQAQEKHLRDRLADQIHTRFTSRPTQALEDLSLGTLRPTSLVRAYDDLYREGRVDSLDALDALPELMGMDILKMKILFSVIVLAFRCVQQHLHELRVRLRHLLCLPVPSVLKLPHPDTHAVSQFEPDPISAQMEDHISKYLTQTVERHDVEPIVNEVCQNIYATLYDYPGLQTCEGLVQYARTAVRLAWGLSVQVPPYTISYDARSFVPQNHDRFHTSDSDSDEIKSFLWPMLVDGQTGLCVTRGVVIT